MTGNTVSVTGSTSTALAVLFDRQGYPICHCEPAVWVKQSQGRKSWRRV
jgi:hypothetical protein